METKYQEALTNLFCTCCKRCNNQNNCSNCTIRLSKNVLQELVDKETPKTPIYIERDEETDGGDACPNCYSYMGINFESNYCTQCGQRLDWSKK